MKHIRNYTDLQHLVNSIIPIIPYIELTFYYVIVIIFSLSLMA